MIPVHRAHLPSNHQGIRSKYSIGLPAYLKKTARINSANNRQSWESLFRKPAAIYSPAAVGAESYFKENL
jgi:hypothetical protein